MIAPTNPYASTQHHRLPQQLHEQLLLHSCSGKENSSEAANMVGLQSQWRGGSIKNCKMRAVKLKIRSNSRKIAEQHKKNKRFLQQAVDGGIAFVPHLVHQAIEIGPQSRRELTLTITKARCMVIGNQPGPIIPVIPIAPARPLPALLPQYPITTHIYDNNSVCCLEFLKYLDKAKSKGRLPPGPKPHHSSCPRKLARKSASKKAPNK